MSACSGRNYNFRCINVVFWRVFRETAHTVAKSRTNLAQIQEKLPNRWTDWHQIWHTCADSSGNGYLPNQLNLKTHGGISGGFRGSQIQKSWELGCQTTGPIRTKFGTRLRIRLGMDVG